ncbi:hypothetical protein D3C85_1741250 [compost metagenome]
MQQHLDGVVAQRRDAEWLAAGAAGKVIAVEADIEAQPLRAERLLVRVADAQRDLELLLEQRGLAGGLDVGQLHFRL